MASIWVNRKHRKETVGSRYSLGCSVPVRSLKSDGRSKLLSGGPLYVAPWVSLSLPCPFRPGVVSPADANLGAECYIIPVPLLLLLIVSLLNSSQVTFSFFIVLCFLCSFSP